MVSSCGVIGRLNMVIFAGAYGNCFVTCQKKRAKFDQPGRRLGLSTMPEPACDRLISMEETWSIESLRDLHYRLRPDKQRSVRGFNPDFAEVSAGF